MSEPKWYPDEGRIVKGDREVHLSPAQALIYAELWKRYPAVTPVSQIAESITASNNATSVYIHRMRQKGIKLETHWRWGYRLAPGWGPE